MTRKYESDLDETGAVLLLAIAFMLIGSIVSFALLSWSGSAILTDSRLQQSNEMRFEASTLAQAVLEQERYVYQDEATLPIDLTTRSWECTPPNYNSSFNNTFKEFNEEKRPSREWVAFCGISRNEKTTSSRVLTISVCDATDLPVIASECVGSTEAGLQLSYLSAVVQFNDLTYNKDSQSWDNACTRSQYQWSCGIDVVISKWLFR